MSAKCALHECDLSSDMHMLLFHCATRGLTTVMQGHKPAPGQPQEDSLEAQAKTHMAATRAFTIPLTKALFSMWHTFLAGVLMVPQADCVHLSDHFHLGVISVMSVALPVAQSRWAVPHIFGGAGCAELASRLVVLFMHPFVGAAAIARSYGPRWQLQPARGGIPQCFICIGAAEWSSGCFLSFSCSPLGVGRQDLSLANMNY